LTASSSLASVLIPLMSKANMSALGKMKCIIWTRTKVFVQRSTRWRNLRRMI
jgi:hypothetical protein